MKTFIIGDPHITEQDIPELENIFTELICKSINPKAYTFVMLGDYYNNSKPNAQEILFGTKWAQKFKDTFKAVIFLRGNHDRSKEISAIDYLKYLGIKIVDDYIDEDNILFGHWMLYESKLEYGTGKCGIKDLEKYNKVFLGHQHSFQELKKDKIYHLGSVHYCSFNEVNDIKQIAFLDKNEIKFIPLKSPIPMIEVSPGDCPYYSEEQLKKINPQTKVRLVISNFQHFKNEINNISKYKNKFHEFKVKLDFDTIVCKTNTKKQYSKLQDILIEGIKNIKDKEVRELLEIQFKGKENG